MDPDEQKNVFTVHKLLKNLIQTVNAFLKKWFSRKEFYTLMVVPHTPLKNVKSVRFPRLLVSIFVLFNITAFAVVCTFVVSYHSIDIKLKSKRMEYQELQNMNESNEEQLSQYKSSEEDIKKKMQELKELENKLKNIIESKGGKPQSSINGPIIASRGTSKVLFQISSQPSSVSPNIDDLFSSADKLENDISCSIKELDDVMSKAEQAMKAMRAMPSILPTYGTITSLFGYREDPFGKGSEYHTGIDISNRKGTPIKASGDGIVVEAGWDSGYGNLIRINHQNGYESLYGHNSKIAVSVGQYVKRGQIIGYMGSTGRTTGTHCHFEVRYNGKPVNPYTLK